MKKIFIKGAFLILLGCLACAHSGPKVQAGDPSASPQPALAMQNTPVSEWVILDKGTQCAITAQGFQLLKTQAAFDQLWHKSFDGFDMPPKKPVVDFGNRWVVAAFLGMKNAAGYDLDIASITREGQTTVITIKTVQPGPNCLNAAVLEFPYLFASVPQYPGDKVEFKTETAVRDCE